MTQHTQGEWTVRPKENDPFFGLEIVALKPVGPEYLVAPHVNKDADARLIASAPKLLAALEEYRDIQSQNHQESLGTTFMIGSKERLEEWERDMQAAIAAAKGE